MLEEALKYFDDLDVVVSKMYVWLRTVLRVFHTLKPDSAGFSVTCNDFTVTFDKGHIFVNGIQFEFIYSYPEDYRDIVFKFIKNFDCIKEAVERTLEGYGLKEFLESAREEREVYRKFIESFS